MATKVITGNGGNILDSDFHALTWTGKTKGGVPVKITLDNGLNMGNLEWTLAEKNEVVPAIEFEACYDNADTQADETTKCPWKVEMNGDVVTGEKEILLGLGVFAIDGVDVGLCRGGGSFKIEREFRPIAADGDKGTVKGRVAMDTEKAKLSMNVLTMLTSVAKLYPALEEKAGEEAEG